MDMSPENGMCHTAKKGYASVITKSDVCVSYSKCQLSLSTPRNSDTTYTEVLDTRTYQSVCIDTFDQSRGSLGWLLQRTHMCST